MKKSLLYPIVVAAWIGLVTSTPFAAQGTPRVQAQTDALNVAVITLQSNLGALQGKQQLAKATKKKKCHPGCPSGLSVGSPNILG